MNILSEEAGELGYLPVITVIKVTIIAKKKNAICETGLCRFIKSIRAGGFISTNLIVLY
jgi:hypothetical protein